MERALHATTKAHAAPTASARASLALPARPARSAAQRMVPVRFAQASASAMQTVARVNARPHTVAKPARLPAPHTAGRCAMATAAPPRASAHVQKVSMVRPAKSSVRRRTASIAMRRGLAWLRASALATVAGPVPAATSHAPSRTAEFATGAAHVPTERVCARRPSGVQTAACPARGTIEATSVPVMALAPPQANAAALQAMWDPLASACALVMPRDLFAAIRALARILSAGLSAFARRLTPASPAARRRMAGSLFHRCNTADGPDSRGSAPVVLLLLALGMEVACPMVAAAAMGATMATTARSDAHTMSSAAGLDVDVVVPEAITPALAIAVVGDGATGSRTAADVSAAATA